VVPNRLAFLGWRLLDLDLGGQYLFAVDRPVEPYIRLLVSSSFWKVWNVGDGSTASAMDGSGNPAELSTQELLVRGAAGLHYQVAPEITLGFEAAVSYHTGIGTDFSKETTDQRSRAQGAIFLVGTWNLNAQERGPAGRSDRFSTTAPFVPVTTSLTPGDSDGDGVPDGVDRCPGTPLGAANWVDAFGCPVDSDRDGVPDYLDRCGSTPLGTPVGEDGCVIDSDGDGVSDLLDHCPDTPPGFSVDAAGCPNQAPLSKKLVFRFNYESGESELDADARAQLLLLVPTLKQNPDTRVMIAGFTDNVGSADANMTLSQKRADRVKAFFVGQGIPTGQITAVGRGASDFVASNDTSEGRAQNRRIEISPLQ